MTPSEGEPERLARRVARQHPELSYSRAKRAVEAGQVTVEGEVERDPGLVVSAEQAVVLDRNRKITPPPTRRDVELLHADGDVAVAVKPAGLLTVPTSAREKDTLVSRVSLALTRVGGRRPYVGVVHRLDKETSGLVVFATSRRGHESLQRQLAGRSLSRIYEAVVEGEMEAAAGSFERALIGDGTRRRRWVAAEGERGKSAVTHWSVLDRFGVATRVRVSLETGRTHQIRIHFAAARHPVVGDRVYRPAAGLRGSVPIRFPRLALHAAELGFVHPSDGKPRHFECPRPADLEELLHRLAAGPKRPRRAR